MLNHVVYLLRVTNENGNSVRNKLFMGIKNRTYQRILMYHMPKTFSKPIKIKETLSGLRQFLARENPLKMGENAFYLTSKAIFVLKVFKFLFCLFGHVSNWLD